MATKIFESPGVYIDEIDKTAGSEIGFTNTDSGDTPTDPGTGTNDHNQLINRTLANQHPVSAITGLESQLKDLNTKITANTTAIGNNSSKVDDLETKTNENTESNTKISEELSSLETTVNGFESSISSVQSGLETTNTNVASLETNVSSIQSGLDANNANVSDLSSEVEELKSTVEGITPIEYESGLGSTISEDHKINVNTPIIPITSEAYAALSVDERKNGAIYWLDPPGGVVSGSGNTGGSGNGGTTGGTNSGDTNTGTQTPVYSNIIPSPTDDPIIVGYSNTFNKPIYRKSFTGSGVNITWIRKTLFNFSTSNGLPVGIQSVLNYSGLMNESDLTNTGNYYYPIPFFENITGTTTNTDGLIKYHYYSVNFLDANESGYITNVLIIGADFSSTSTGLPCSIVNFYFDFVYKDGYGPA